MTWAKMGVAVSVFFFSALEGGLDPKIVGKCRFVWSKTGNVF